MSSARAQELGGAGTVEGTITDTTGGAMQAVTVTLSNPVTQFTRNVTTDTAGKFVIRNIPPNPYHLSIEVQGFKTYQHDLDIRSAVPIDLTIKLEVGLSEAVSVVANAETIVERDPTAHTDIGQAILDKLPLPATPGLNQVITLASPGVVADSNGFFHPVGDHAQTQFSIDNQPITDQQSRLYSNQLSQDAVQSMEIITGVPPAEYGDKTSLVVHIVTKSGLDQARPTGTATFGYGKFKSPTGELDLGAGSHTVGDFISVTGLRTDRYLDSPEFTALNDNGNQFSIFNRLDYHPDAADSFHFDVQAARSKFGIPNTYDQDALGTNQRQNILTFDIAPGYTRVIGSDMLLTANAYVRRDHLKYLPSTNVFADLPATVSQDRMLTNIGGKVDLAYTRAHHNLKFGGEFSATPLHEQFALGITDPTDPTWADENGNFDPIFAPYDLTNGGAPLVYDQSFTVKEQSVYAQDDITAGRATINAGLRLDHYQGLVTTTQASPRLGLSFAVPRAGTVLRASYGRTMETPYNENLLLSAGLGLNGLFGGGGALPVGVRNEVEVGGQQGFGKWVVADLSYYDKHTDNAYDFNVLFNTPIAFPISWATSHLYGLAGRVDLIEHRGFSAFFVMATTNAIYAPPATGGILIDQPPGPFRIDHDQKFNSTFNAQYAFAKSIGAWAAVVWRYDSGEVPSAVPDFPTALTLDADQQAAMGLFCGSQVATVNSPPITSCSAASYGTTRLVLPLTPANPDPEDDVNNPSRIAPRNLFDVALGSDNLLHGKKTALTVRLSVVNITNNEALYNFLSTFTGTHFVSPRAAQV
ncbi:MAG: TonB-dependent receptor, partial [Vicinamibacterales bacterium]